MHSTVAMMLVATMAVGFLTGLFEQTMSLAMTDALYTLVGLLFFISGIWAAVLLFRVK